MGVRGLKSFIEKNSALFENEYHLHDCHVIIDASNLIFELFILSQKHERRDLFGGDLVQYGRYVNKFLDNLERCKITPIFVFDGAQTHDKHKSKTAEKHRRALEKFQSVMSINKSGFGDITLPASTTNVFRSIVVDRNLTIVQCMFEADLQVARIARENNSPVLSNDSDFFLIDLPDGLVPLDLLDHEHVKRVNIASGSDKDNRIMPLYEYIECSLFKQANFSKYIPQLQTRNLILLGTLAGNDFIDGHVFDRICGGFSRRRLESLREFKKPVSKQHEKIVKILYFLCDKTLNEAVNQVCLHVPKEKRKPLKDLINNSLSVYEIPMEDDFRLELVRLYPLNRWLKPGQQNGIENNKNLYEDKIDKIMLGLKRSMEKSVLSYRCLELAHRNNIFIICHMDDPQLPSAHKCQLRTMRVMLAILKSTIGDCDDDYSCHVYDRIGYNYGKTTITPEMDLKYFGRLDTVNIFELFDMPAHRRRSLLLATFHCSDEIFDENVVQYYFWLEANHAEEFLLIKLLMDYIDIESNNEAKLWKHFRQATLLCMLHHFSTKDKPDETLISKLEETNFSDFMAGLGEIIKSRHFNRAPSLSKRRKYNCRLMHQITQLHCSIISFNGLNALLGDTVIRIRQETWLNSCIIYNLAEGLHQKSLKLVDMPTIVHEVPRAHHIKTRQICQYSIDSVEN